jgi:hypothetical protein
MSALDERIMLERAQTVQRPTPAREADRRVVGALRPEKGL